MRTLTLTAHRHWHAARVLYEARSWAGVVRRSLAVFHEVAGRWPHMKREWHHARQKLTVWEARADRQIREDQAVWALDQVEGLVKAYAEDA